MMINIINLKSCNCGNIFISESERKLKMFYISYKSRFEPSYSLRATRCSF